jgi:LuxR family maltose regulon positive regulatory protein
VPGPPPPLRVGFESVPEALVARTHLVDRLIAARRVPVALIAAPAGYGKTVLVRQWAELDERPFAHVTLEEGHDDPALLARACAEALNLLSTDEDAVLGALATMGEPFVLVVENAHILRARRALDLLAAMIEQLGPGCQIALVSRTEPRLAVARLRANRRLVELRASDLVMTRAEAAALAKLSGLELDGEALDLVVTRTEGWPAGLYLAMLVAGEADDPEAAFTSFGGDDRLVADYLREEVLSGFRATEVEFLTRSSILGRLTGPLCDFVLERTDSARLLKTLSRMNLLVVPLDRTDTEYRYHRLFGQMLRGELRRGEPELERRLHRRASEWYEQHEDPDRGIEHAIAADDPERAGQLLWEHANAFISYGRNDKVCAWLARFSREQIASCPALALTAAATQLATGNGGMTEHLASAARSALGRAGSLEPAASVLEASVARDGIVRMGEEAARAYELERAESPWRAVACMLMGVSAHLVGDRERARGCLEEGGRRGAAVAPNAQVLCLAQLALLALEEDDADTAGVLAARAKAQVERIGLKHYATSALVYAVSADVLARLGRVEDAQRDVETGKALLDALTDFAPWYELECRITLARAALRMSELPRARVLLAEAARGLQQVPDAPAAREWFDECSAQADAAIESFGDGGWALTTAELRVLQFLPTHLSLPEIAGELFVSPNTVKTHARAVYRKLDASSRGEAVDRARGAGLLVSHAD